MSFLASDTFWVGVGLVLFLAILVKANVPAMLLGALDNRAKAIQSELEEARKLREEATAVLAQYKAKQAEAEAEAKAIVSAAQAEAKRLKAEAKAKIDDFVTRRTKQAEFKIAQAEAQATAEVRNAAADAAIAAAGSLLGTMAQGAGGADLLTKGIAEVKAKLN